MPYKDIEQKRQHDREYYHQHKKQRLKHRQEYYQKNKKRIAEYNRQYNKQNKQKIMEEKMSYYFANRKQIRKQQKERYKKIRELINRIFGDKCVICGDSIKKHLLIHEVHGKKHPPLTSFKVIFSLNRDDFVCLCKRCHKSLHGLKKRNGNIKAFLRLFGLIL